MKKRGNADVVGGLALSWRGALIGIVMLSLVVSLATRTFHQRIPQGVTVHSNTAQAARQHMVRDSARWVPPVFIHTAQLAPVFYPHVAPAGPPIPALLLIEESLYNRPPPSC
ncbi:MAG: hypothetical protein ACLP6G_10955 [Terriglobales bacterium]